jgi:DNA-binding MurR/RpiR family transcriptional regulator
MAGDASDDRAAIADRVRSVMPTFTAAERKVARRLLAGEPTAGLGSSSLLATKAGVSGPTVTRFVKKLGFEDYGAFQDAIRAEIDARVLAPVDILQAGGASRVGGVNRYGTPMAASVQRTLDRLSEHEFEAAASRLADVKSPVITVGGWTSLVLARHLATQLQQVRPAVHFAGEAPSDVSSWVADAGPKVTAVLFDLRRYEHRTIATAQALKDKSAHIILVTDTWLSPAAEVAHVVLPADVEAGQGFDTLLPAMAIVEALVDRAASLLGDAAVKRLTSYNAVSIQAAPRWRSGEENA